MGKVFRICAIVGTIAGLAVPAVASAKKPPAKNQPAAGASCANADLVPDATNLALVRDAIVCLVNVERADRGLKPLAQRGTLTHVGVDYSAVMVRDQFFDHTGLDGSTPLSRVKASGYLKHARTWATGENLAWGEGELATATSTVDTWMHSPPHRKNILTSKYRDVGVGLVMGAPAATEDPANAVTCTTEFGFRKS